MALAPLANALLYFFGYFEIKDMLVKIDLTASKGKCLRNPTSAVEQSFCESANAGVLANRARKEAPALFGVDVFSTPMRVE